MRFLVDECAGPALGLWLRNEGHDVFSVFEQARGISDDAVIRRAHNEKRILITADKDFGYLAFRKREPHRGIILFRLKDERPSIKIKIMERLLNLYAERLPNAIIVVTEEQVRFARERNR